MDEKTDAPTGSTGPSAPTGAQRGADRPLVVRLMTGDPGTFNGLATELGACHRAGLEGLGLWRGARSYRCAEDC